MNFGSLLDTAAAEDALVVELRVAVSEALAAARTEPDELPEVAASGRADAATTDTTDTGARTGINPRYTFDVFVIGASNRFAHAARPPWPRRRQSRQPAVHLGRAGLGKTHLMQAIGNTCFGSTRIKVRLRLERDGS